MSSARISFGEFLEQLRRSWDYQGQIVHIERLPAREALYADLMEPLPEPLLVALQREGIQRLYLHQVEAIERARRGENLVVVTAAASGKTLCYNLPILEAWLKDRQSRALYLFPTKALAQDQLRILHRLRAAHPALDFVAGTYDGDTPRETRTLLRERGHLILTNPDMLHSGILPNHARWSEFLSQLKFVVVDEIHTYRGVFGSNVALVLRRLNRLCQHYGSNPLYICSSATIANPLELAEALTDRPMHLIDRDGSPQGPKMFVFWNPPFLSEGQVERRSPNTEAQRLMVELVRHRIQTIAFTRARVVAELLYRYCQEALQKVAPSLAQAIAPYRSGYLPEERREIEQRLFRGELLGVTSTNALELGIDIGSLDACLLVGYPGSIASTWQQAGRAGRGQGEALVVLIARNNPIDQYLMQRPDYFFGQSPEHAIIDPKNAFILLAHLRCAVSELPLTLQEAERWGGEFAPAILELLREEGQVRRVGDTYFWSGRGYPAADVNLRSLFSDVYTIQDVSGDKPQVIGTLDAFSAFLLVHPEAVYLHQGETYFVKELDLTQKVALVEKADLDYYTQALTETKIRVDAVEEQRPYRVSELFFGDVTVTMLVTMFRKIKFYSLDSLGYGNLNLPPQELETVALWLVPPASALQRVREFGRVPYEGMLGIANALLDVAPLFVMCDPMDIGCVVDSANTGRPTLFLYDRYPDGLGFARKAYELMDDILEACLLLIHECECEAGCPSCVGYSFRGYVYYDADTGVQERIPDKEAALVILHELLEKEPYIPKPLPLEERTGRPLSEPPPSRPSLRPLPEHVEQKIRRRIQRLKR